MWVLLQLWKLNFAELVFGHVWTCDLLSSRSKARPYKFVLLYSVARKTIYITELTTEKVDLTNLLREYQTCKRSHQKNPKRLLFGGGIASCSVNLLLRVVNVQAIHVYQLVRAQGHVHDALDSSTQYQMQLHDLMLHSSLRLFNMQFGILRRNWAAPPLFHETLVQGRSISSSSRDSSFVDYVLQKESMWLAM